MRVGGAALRCTRRLTLRPFEAADGGWFAAMNADPDVMRHFASTLDRPSSDGFLSRIIAGWDERGWCLWAVEGVVAGPLREPLGFVGLNPAPVLGPETVEVGWRLRRAAWGQGYAPEAAREAVRVGFDVLGVEEIVSFTVTANHNSRRVMAKIGLRHDPARDFDHPGIDPVTHPHLVRHVLYVATGPR